MILNLIYMFFSGYVYVSVEGFFIERFINICRSKNIILQELHRENNTYIKFKLLKSDFKDIRHIAKKSKCKVKIEKKIGIPFIINRYRKRKIFAVAILVIAIFIFILTKFIWNIEVQGNEKVSKEEVLEIVKEYGISIGTYKGKIDVQKISNLIRLERDDFAWIGISIQGTNAIITVKDSIDKPEIIDKTEICNIVANKKSIISKIIVQNGTARVKVGDEVNEGDLLVEGIMEGKYTEDRFVHAEATIYGKSIYEKEKKESFLQNQKVKTGNIEHKNKICINNFKINLNKGVSKFKNYDTIMETKKIKLFSIFYIPIEIQKITNEEFKIEEKYYQTEELKEKIISELEAELENEFHLSNYKEENKKRDIVTNSNTNELTVKLIYEIQEKIGIEKTN